MRITKNPCTLICCWQGNDLIGTVAIGANGVLVTGRADGQAQVKLNEASKLVPSMGMSILPDDYDERQNLQRMIRKALEPRTCTAGHYPIVPHKGEAKKFVHNPEVKRYIDKDGIRSVAKEFKAKE